MKKLWLIGFLSVVCLLFISACGSDQTVRFKLEIMNQPQLDYYICAQNQDVKVKLEFENYAFTEKADGTRIYDVTVRYPEKAAVREDGRSFWTFYTGFIYEYGETFTNTVKNVGIRSGQTTVRLDRSGGSVLYDTVKTVYDDGSFTFYIGDGMDGENGILHDIQFIWYVDEDGQRQGGGDILPGATIKLLGQNAPDANGDVETWFSVISGAEGVGELHRFNVTTKGEGQRECTLTRADLPEVVSEQGAKWLDDAEFAESGIKPETDVKAMKAAFGEPISSRREYGSQNECIAYEYGGVKYVFISSYLVRDGWMDVNKAYYAEFTKNLAAFPRGIKIGDSFADVLKKFPQEMDYKDEMSEGCFYGDYWRKDKLGWGSVQVVNNHADIEDGIWISVICDEYWPMLKVHFTDELIADKITVQFGPSPHAG